MTGVLSRSMRIFSAASNRACRRTQERFEHTFLLITVTGATEEDNEEEVDDGGRDNNDLDDEIEEEERPRYCHSLRNDSLCQSLQPMMIFLMIPEMTVPRIC